MDTIGLEDWRIVEVARAHGFDVVALLDDGVIVLASVDLEVQADNR